MCKFLIVFRQAFSLKILLIKSLKKYVFCFYTNFAKFRQEVKLNNTGRSAFP